MAAFNIQEALMWKEKIEYVIDQVCHIHLHHSSMHELYLYYWIWLDFILIYLIEKLGKPFSSYIAKSQPNMLFCKFILLGFVFLLRLIDVIELSNSAASECTVFKW